MEVYSDGSGLAHARSLAGPFAGAIIASAGYMGAPLWGTMIVAIARDVRGARRSLLGLGFALVSTAAFAIDNRFGMVTIGATGASILAVAAMPRPRWHLALAYVIAAQACIGAVVDIRVLFRPNLVVDGAVVRDSDAHAMAYVTFGSDANWAVWTWAGLWLAWSLLLLFVTLRRLRGLASMPPRDNVDRCAGPTVRSTSEPRSPHGASDPPTVERRTL
jgi:Peptidase M50B-like